MIKIAICDDNRIDAENAKAIIKQSLEKLHESFEIVYYHSAEEIEEKMLVHKEDIDILILDIDMPKISGLELAETLRKNNLNLIIIFLSNHEEFVFKAFEFQPFRYIRKSVIEIEMPPAINSALKLLKVNQDKQVVLNTDDGEMTVMLSEILYLETERRKVSVHLRNGKNTLVKMSINEMTEHISSEKFVMIHRSCVINADAVKNIKNGILILDNDEKLIISRTRYKEVKQKLLNLWGDII